jgi:hypothetical protein
MSSVASQLLEDLEPVTVSELEIENDSIVLVDHRERSGFFAAGCDVDGVGFVPQHALDQFQYGAVVVDYENAHSAVIVISLEYRSTRARVTVDQRKKGREQALSPFFVEAVKLTRTVCRR